MASRSSTTVITPRDREVLRILQMLPLTPEQLLTWSQCLAHPFPEVGTVRRRLRKLAAARLVQRWPYAIATGGGTPFYFKLTRNGHRLLHDDGFVRPRTKRAFAAIGMARHHHSKSLADFIVHTAATAHRLGITFTEFYGENHHRIQVSDELLYSDASFRLTAAGASRRFCVELDNSTESIVSPRDADSVARKIRLYDNHLADCGLTDPGRYTVLFVTTRSEQRLRNILAAAAAIVRNPNRLVFSGVYLPAYLAMVDPLTTACFRDHRGRPAAMFPTNLLGQSRVSGPATVCPSLV